MRGPTGATGSEGPSPADDAGLFRELFEASPDGILIVDPQTLRAALFNDAACRQLGYSRDEFSRLAITDHEAIQSADEVKTRVAAVLRDGHAEFDTRHRTSSGELRDMHVWVRTISHQGRPAFFAIVRDITDRVRSEEMLRQNAELLARSQRVAHVGHWMADFRTGVSVWSEETRRIYGVGAEMPASFEAFLDLVHADDRDRLQAWAAAAVADRRPPTIRFRIVRPDGTERFIDGDGDVQLDESGRPVAVFGTVVDVTDRRRAMTRVAENEAKFRTLFEAAQDAIFVMNSEVFVDCNQRTETLFGRPKFEIVGRSPIDLSPPRQPDGRSSADSAAQRISAAMAGEPQFFHWVHLRRDGTPFDAEVCLNRIDIGGEALLQAIVRDITERLRLEAQFRQAQKMESVGHLASGVAHDFNNLLTVINGLTELMLEQLTESDPIRKDLNEIHAAGERAATLTRQLLAFSRQQILMPKVMDLNAAVVGIEGLLRRLLGEDIEIVLALTPGGATVKADPGQIEQVIANLAVNARDAMPTGGRLTLQTAHLTLGADRDTGFGPTMPKGRYVTLSVSDTGTGMDDATRSRVFEPFFTTKGPGRGTGLGLSTVYGVVQQSQGFVTVASEIGHGAMFTIYLPQIAAGLVEERMTPAGASRGTETVLVVEDNAGLGVLTRRFLEKAGYTVLTADHGAAALDVLQRGDRPVHLVLTDVVMPSMSGRELAAEVSRRYPAVKILYMSGYTSDTVVRHGVSESTVSFISKPFTAQGLSAKVREALDGP